MSAELVIKTALNEALENLSLPYAKAPENTEIDWNLQEPFIRSYDQPVLKQQCTLGVDGANIHKGIFHIEVCYPSNTGSIKAVEVANLIMPTFKRGTKLVQDGNTITCEKVEIKTAYTENTWYILPIFVVYNAYMEN